VPFGGISGKAVVSAGGATMAAYGIALQGTQIVIGDEKAGATRDELVARIEVDLLFADGLD